MRLLIPAAVGSVIAMLGVALVALALNLTDGGSGQPGGSSLDRVTDSRQIPPAGSFSRAVGDYVSTESNLKVAFIGDSGNGPEFRAVLELIKSEGADLVVHSGDFDYEHNPEAFFSTVDDVLGPDFPYLGSVGNHDVEAWNEGCGHSNGCYAQFFKERMERTGIAPDDPDLNDQMYSSTFNGLKLVFAGEDSNNTGDCDDNSDGYACYIRNQLSADNHVWKICNWHKNQNAMQVGGKDDEMGWAVYENCKDAGAIIATAHEHSYQRTLTLTSMQDQAVDTSQHPLAEGVPGNPEKLRVAPGASFVFVSGLGGKSMREQARCLPDGYPYGCNREWASIYTTNQTSGKERFGASFIEFNVDGDPNKASGYFKNTDGEVIDEFEVLAETGTPLSYPSFADAGAEETPAPVASATPSPDRNRSSDGNAVNEGSELKIKGTVTAIRDGVVTVNTEGDRQFDVSLALEPNDFVEIEGIFSNGSVSASEVEREDGTKLKDEIENGVAEIKGRLVSISNGLVTVRTANDRLVEARLGFEVGDSVEVEGILSEGLILAFELEHED